MSNKKQMPELNKTTCRNSMTWMTSRLYFQAQEDPLFGVQAKSVYSNSDMDRSGKRSMNLPRITIM